MKAAESGLETSVTVDDETYEPRDGYALVDLGQDLTEWQTRDFRAYLQRPVVNVYAIIEAIRRLAVGLGYKIELDYEFFRATNPYYNQAWMALPMLTDLVKDKVTYSGQTSAGHGGRQGQVANSSLYPFPIPHGTTPSMQNLYDVVELATGYEPSANDEIVAQIPLQIRAQGFNNANLQPGEKLWLSAEDSGQVIRVIMIETYGFDENDNVIKRGPIKGYASKILHNGEEVSYSLENFANWTNYQPLYIGPLPDYEFGGLVFGNFEVASSGLVADWVGPDVVASITGKGIAKIRIYVNYQVFDSSGQGSVTQLNRNRSDRSSVVNYSNFFLNIPYGAYKAIADGETRSDTPITKKDLLSLDMTPADFLLYYARRFGLMFRTDPDGKTVHVETRRTFFLNEVYDIDDRIAVERGNSVSPLPFDARVLQMHEDGIGSAYPKAYEERYGRKYGSKRLNTGYEFNADTKDIFSKSVFKTAAEVKKQDVTFVTVTDENGHFQIPAVFLLGGMKYYLFAQQGTERTELAVPAVSDAARLDYFDTIFNGYDMFSRPEFQDADNNPVDATGVLLFLQGFYDAAPGSAVTNDNALMYTLSDGACWYLDPAKNGLTVPTIPLYGRYIWQEGNWPGRSNVIRQMDFGTPAEIDIPGAFISEGCDIYARFWEKYIGDRYNKDTKTVTLYISTRGLPMSIERMRPFFWFRGSRWALNKIIDYDITGDGVTKCEFVQVQDPANYRQIETF